jgi:hypothetical protein
VSLPIKRNKPNKSASRPYITVGNIEICARLATRIAHLLNTIPRKKTGSAEPRRKKRLQSALADPKPKAMLLPDMLATKTR